MGMVRTGLLGAGVRACLSALLLLALPSAALAHDFGAPHPHGATYHEDPKAALPSTLITQPVAAAELGSLDPLSVDEGTAPETWCGDELPTTNDTANAVVAAGAPHYKLVYAYAADQTNRFASFKDRLQATVSLLQRFLAIQSDGKKALRWDTGTVCGPQYVDIQVVQLPQNRDYYVPGGAPSFERTSADVLTALGGAGAPRNVAIYADGLRGTNGVAGTAWRYFTSDTMATAHDGGGLAAVVYGTQTLPTGTYADPGVMMHEIGHNLGAVADPAPHSSLAGHCYDEWDVMCYADGGARGKASDMVPNCSAIAGEVTETFDCGRDDYFNSNPPQDSYLDLNWNSYAVAHLGPCSTELVDSCGLTTPSDGTRPTNTTAIPAWGWRSGWSTPMTGTDSESTVNAYQWRYADHGQALGSIQHGQQISISGAHAGQVNLFNRVRDSAGNWSAWRGEPVLIDSIAPSATVTCPSAWSTTTAPICTYSVSDQGSSLHSVETQTGSNPAVPNFPSGTITPTADAQTIRARGRDWVANVGDWGSDTARWDRVDPAVSVTCPAEPSVGSTTCHVDASDAASGIDTVTWRVGDGTPTEVDPNSDFAVTVPGEQTITVVAADVAGRTSQATAASHVTTSSAPSGTDGAVTTDEDTAHALTPSSFGFSDPDDGDTFAEVRVDTLPTAGSLTSGGSAVTAGSSYAPGALLYTPTSNGCGAAYASFTFSVRDSAGNYDDTPNTMTVHVTCVDDAPAAVNDSLSLNEDASATTVNVLANDTDVDEGEKKVASKTDGAHGTVAITNNGADLTYAPAPNYCGPDSFTYTPNGGSTATVNVTVTCVDDSPNAVDDLRTVDEDSGSTALDVRTNDTDPDGGSKAVVSATTADHGIVVSSNGDLTYTPLPNYCGPDSFDYTLNGGSTATVTLTVTCVDDAPVAVIDIRSVDEDSSAAPLGVLGNDTDFEGGTKTVVSRTNAEHGTVTVTAQGTDVTYAPAANYCGPDSFTYTLNGGSSAVVTVNVTCSDDAPSAANDSKTLDQDSGAISIDVRANDTDIDDGPKTITGKTDGAHGQVAITNGGDGLTYTPAAGYCGPDSFSYTLNGGSTATVAITVNCKPPPVVDVDDAPSAVGDAATVGEDAPATAIDVRANDTDPDGGPKMVASKTNGAHGAVAITNAGNDLSYAPAANYCGNDSFTYALNGNSTATVNVTVDCVDDAPSAVNDVAPAMEDFWVLANVLPNDTDIDDGPKVITAKTNGSHGLVLITEHGDAVVYRAVADYCGPDRFTYTLNGGSTATVDVNVACVEDVEDRGPQSAPADTEAPVTKFAQGPKKKITTTSRTAKVTFKLASSEPGSTFLCKLDKGKFRKCGPKTSYTVKPGRHRLVVVAIDTSGNADATPLKKKFSVVRLRKR